MTAQPQPSPAHIDIHSPAEFQDAAMRCGNGEFILTDVIPGQPGDPYQWRWLVIWPDNPTAPEPT